MTIFKRHSGINLIKDVKHNGQINKSLLIQKDTVNANIFRWADYMYRERPYIVKMSMFSSSISLMHFKQIILLKELRN